MLDCVQVNRQLRDKQEQVDVKLCNSEKNITDQKSHYELQVEQLKRELCEFKSMRDCLSIKEEELESISLEREDLKNRLSLVEHQLAIERMKGEGQVEDKEQQLLAQLRSQGELSETLRGRSVCVCVYLFHACTCTVSK